MNLMIRPSINFLGIRVDSLTLKETVNSAIELIDIGGTHQHVVINAAKLVASVEDASLRNTINSCSIVTADGQSIVWASRFLGQPLPERVTGIDFMYAMVQAAVEKSYGIYLLGSTNEVLQSVVTQFEARGARIVGSSDGFWRGTRSDEELVKEIAESQAHILFVALPSPMKEQFLAHNLSHLNVNLLVGVGGSFDVVAGKTRRAPLWAQRAGFEWLFRMIQEPRRMMKRYLVGNTKFVMYVLRQKYKTLVDNGRKL